MFRLIFRMSVPVIMFLLVYPQDVRATTEWVFIGHHEIKDSTGIRHILVGRVKNRFRAEVCLVTEEDYNLLLRRYGGEKKMFALASILVIGNSPQEETFEEGVVGTVTDHRKKLIIKETVRSLSGPHLPNFSSFPAGAARATLGDVLFGPKPEAEELLNCILEGIKKESEGKLDVLVMSKSSSKIFLRIYRKDRIHKRGEFPWFVAFTRGDEEPFKFVNAIGL